MEQNEIERLRGKLEFKRHETRQYLRQIEQERRSLDADSTQYSADRCALSTAKELLYERSSHRTTDLRLIEAALRRIADGSFGRCIGCGDDIESRRLEALPWTQFCFRCQGELESEIGSSVSARASSTPTTDRWKRAG